MADNEGNDLAKLSELDEQLILDRLNKRYAHETIYTYVGDILIAVNPFKPLPIYSKQYSNLYKFAQQGTNPPHVFAVVDKAYQDLLGLGSKAPENQCCVISGESGAGKTETCKLMIRQLIDLSTGSSELDQQILLVNPLLEAFGNAKTVMNNNSSRFGKYIQLKFKEKKVDGAKISEYLLEKSRVVHQHFGEQNFHIFYYIFAGLPKEKLNEFCLEKSSSFRYIKNGIQSMSRNFIAMQKEYDNVCNAMDIVGFLEEEQHDMHKILAGILHLGNIEIMLDENDFACVKENKALLSASLLLGLDSLKLSDVLTSFVTVTRGSHIKRRYNKLQSQDCRDAMAKALYGRLFSWIVNKTNRLVAPEFSSSLADANEIGLLDIFGFENFDQNSFEQICINMANEQLQFFFNQHIFKWEQDEYHREGIDWSDIKFSDNKPALDFFFGKPVGFLSVLDEESHFPQSTNLSFTQKLAQNFRGVKQVFQGPKSDTSLSFCINHYAGKVQYDTQGFLEKNRDTIPPGMVQILQHSDNKLISQIFSATITRTGTLALQGRYTIKGKRDVKPKKLSGSRQKFMANKKAVTVGTQFKNSLTLLMEKLNAAAPHFIRCIKPNTEKVPDKFDFDYVKRQLNYTGILETTKIRREGYSVRLTFEEFVNRYKCISLDLSLPPTSQSCAWILHTAKMKQWKIGHSKVFLKYWHLDLLAEYIYKLDICAINIQKGVRGFLDRRRIRKIQIIAEKVAQNISHFISHIERNGSLMLHKESALDRIHVKSMPPPSSFQPLDNFDFPPPPSNMVDHKEKIEIRFGRKKSEEIVEEETELVDDFEVEEDAFKPIPKYDEKKFGRIGTKKAAAKWFQETQIPKGVVDGSSGSPAVWFHGLIPRREAERLLSEKPVGCFLIRVSESKFGYSLSYRTSIRCKHYFIEQTRSGKYVIVGIPNVFANLHQLINHYSKTAINDDGDVLTIPCGQEDDTPDYEDLYVGIKSEKMSEEIGLTPIDQLPPPVPLKKRQSEPNMAPVSDNPPPVPMRIADRSSMDLPPPPIPARNRKR